MNLKINEKDTLKCASKTITGIAFNWNLTHTTADTPFDPISLIDPDRVNVKITLNRFGNQYTLAQDTLQVLHAISNYKNVAWRYTLGANPIVLTAADTGIKENVLIPMSIDFKSPINLQAEDRIDVEIQMNDYSTAAPVDTVASFVEVTEIEGIGFEYMTPYFRSISIKGGETKFDQGLGSKVCDILFLNTDKSSVLASDALISNVQMNSNEYNVSDSYTDILQKRQNMLVYDGDPRDQSFLLSQWDSPILNNVVLKINMNAANVNSGKNQIVYRYFYSDKRLYERARALQAQYQGAVVR